MISWSEEFSVGISSLDADHKRIIELLQELHGAKGSNPGAKAIIERLRTFAEEHFTREEEVMRRYEYAKLEEHQDQHRTFREFIETLARLRDSGTDGNRPVAVATCQFLEQWVATHTLNSDQTFGAFLKERADKQQ